MTGDPIKVLMVCAHEPSLDPRIRWEAAGAARRFDVTVVGFNRADGSCSTVETRDNYKTIRLRQSEISGLYYFWRLKDLLPRSVLLPGAVLGLATLPILVAIEVALRLLYLPARWIIGSLRWLLTKSLILSLALQPLYRRLGSARRLLLARVHYIVAMMRVQFAPAVSVFWNYLREVPEKPDVVHCNDLDTLLVGVLAKMRYGSRLIYDAHEFYPHSDPSGRWLDVSFFSMIERLLIRHADAVVTVNRLLAEAIRGAYGLPDVYAVANAEPWTGPSIKPAGTQMDRLASGRCKFLFQGRFTPGRGIAELITAWAKADANRAALFLRGPDNMWRHGAMTLAAEIGLLDRSVYFLDAVTEEQLISAAAEADVGIIPYQPAIINDRLCCPNKLSQYLHAGLMVVANDLPFVRLVVAEAQAGLIYDSARPDSLVDAVNRIVDDPELLRISQENALRFARERFNWQTEGEKLYALYYPPKRAIEMVPEAIVAPAAE
jgi:glycosyltransferase involved in cell wall biosynthesis